MRQKLVSSNIANADTPGYKTQDFDFQTSLQSMLNGGMPQQDGVQGLETKNDGNNVDLDRESAPPGRERYAIQCGSEPDEVLHSAGKGSH